MVSAWSSATPSPPAASGLPDPAELPRPWTATYPPGVPSDYLMPVVPVTRLLDDAVRDFPQHVAVAAGGLELDHTALRDRADAVADVLAERGVAAGDRVLVRLSNLASLPVVLLAVWRLGAVAVPVDPAADEARVTAILADAAPVAAIGARRSLRALGEDAPPIVLHVEDDRWLAAGRLRRWRLTRRADRQAARLDEAVAATGRSRAARPVPPDAPALLDYRDDVPPRGRSYSHAALVAGAVQTRLWVPDVQAGRERSLVAERLTALEPLVIGWLAGLLAGARVELVDDPGGADLVRAVERGTPTLLTATPRRLRRLLAEADAGPAELGSLRVALTCRGWLGPMLRAEVERRTGGARVRATFAVAGTGPLTHAQPVYGRGAPRTVGPPVTATTAAIVDPADPTRVLGSGQPGRLVVHGPQVPDGVHGRGDDPRLRDGWAATDHLGVIDDDGWLTPLGPLDEVERAAGRWLAPSRVEAALEDHPAVRRAGVVLCDDGQVHAAVVCRRRPRPDLAELTAHCEEQLDPGTVPDRLHQVDELPMTEAGALARDELRASLAGR